MSRENFISEVKARLIESDSLFIYEKGEWPRERRNGVPIPYLLLEIIVFSNMRRDHVRIGAYENGSGTSLKIDVCTIDIKQEVNLQYNDPFYTFSYRTAYDGNFQKKNAADGEIDFDILEFILRDRTPLSQSIK